MSILGFLASTDVTPLSTKWERWIRVSAEFHTHIRIILHHEDIISQPSKERVTELYLPHARSSMGHNPDPPLHARVSFPQLIKDHPVSHLWNPLKEEAS